MGRARGKGRRHPDRRAARARRYRDRAGQARLILTMPDRIARTLGFSLAVSGLPALALALDWLAVPANDLPVPLWAMGCGGASLVFAGSSLLLPASMRRPRGLLAALSISALATLFDWIAFAHVAGGWRFLLESLLDTLALKQN